MVSPLKYIYEKLNLKYCFDNAMYDELIKEYSKTDGITRKTDNFIIFMCDGKLYHGGLTDRLRGALTTYYLAKKLNRPFCINWTSPFELERYLEPNTYDWRISPEQIEYDIRVSTPLVFHIYPPERYWKRNIASFLIFVKWLTKRGKNKHVYTNFHFPRNRFSKLYKELFKPSKLLFEEINKHSAVLGEKYWSFSFRFCMLLGDFTDVATVVPEPLSPAKREELIDKNIKELQTLMKNLPEGYKCLVTSDSQMFLDKVATIDSRIYIVPGQISHIDVDKSCDEAWLKVFVDQNLIMKADKVFLLKTDRMYKSGFAEYAALIGGKEFVYHCF